MAETDPGATQRDQTAAIATELAAEGFEGATEIGRGGFGVVYRCEERALDRVVAIKVLTTYHDPEGVDRFLREQRAMGRLSGHPNIVTIYRVGTTGAGHPYLVMQYHEPGSLQSLIESGPIPWPRVLHLGIKVADALETAHQQSILHRDVKPANILIDTYGEPQLTDFGIARIAGGFETAAGVVTGSPAYTDPDVLLGRPPSPASDIYSLGATLFCALTGHAAFERRRGEPLIDQFRRITNPSGSLLRDWYGEIPEEVCTVIEHAMARDRGNRPRTAADFADQLRRAHHNAEGSATDSGAAPDYTSPAFGFGFPAPHSRTPMPSGRYSAPPTPATRFRPPPPSRTLVTRDRLMQALHTDRRRRLTVIHAPTGYGKSTAAAQWLHQLADEGIATAWLTIDRDDDNPLWFLAHLIEAITTALPALATELRDTFEAHGDRACPHVLTTLINTLHDQDQHLALVLDDWHRVSDPSSVATLTYLLDNGCHHVQIIVTSRTQTGLPMSRMRVRNELVEIDSAVLRFDEDETRSFLMEASGLDLATEDIADLARSTDGWAAAIQLASISLRSSADPAQFIAHLSGRHHAIGDFLAENVLDSLDTDTRAFLLATAIPDRICADLASTLTDVRRGQAMLELIEARDLFLRRVDDEGHWFRYHHMFAEFLRGRLDTEFPGRSAQLHRSASTWFAEHRFLSEAVDHALRAGDTAGAVKLVERDGTYLLEHSQMSTLRGLVDKLPTDSTMSNPRLQLAAAWSNILLYNPGPALQALDRVDTALTHLSASETPALRAEASVIRAVVELRADRASRIDDLVRPCLDRPDDFRPWVVSVAANVATFAKICRADYRAAYALQHWAAAYHQRNNGPYNSVHGHCWVGIAAFEQLDVKLAEASFRTAMKIAQQVDGRRSYTARLAGGLLGEVLYEQGHTAEAERLLDDGYDLGPHAGAVDLKIARYVVGARIKVIHGDRSAAVARLDEGARFSMQMQLPRLYSSIVNESVRLDLVLPSSDASQTADLTYAERAEQVSGLDEVIAQNREEAAITRLVRTGSLANTELACRWAGEWAERLAGSERHRAELRARRLLAGCLAASGRSEEAGSLLTGVAAQCAKAGLVRFLADGGVHVMDTLRQIAGNVHPPSHPPLSSDLPDEFVSAALAADAGLP
ncbi:protein kinase domain-containing protein [Rhodococcus aetherivorans]|uniref:protein kinase domain-containing protein n=1 Tax=Rhodococcus aetherivorans TaxID=191292 RepID=UPI002949923E|nr:protein kinase [Rhodococcus aetherivorans]MDV6293371.1 protein kinase [Rhodococcus aetherivorans]